METKTDFKNLSTKAKIEYIWDYYKLHIFAAISILVVIFYTIHHYATYRAPLLNVIMINTNSSYDTATAGFDEFLDAYEYDSKESPISVASNFYFPEDESIESASVTYTSQQALTAMIAAGSQDLFFGTGDIYLNYANQGALLDLSTVLPSDLLKKYEKQLIYTANDGETASYPCAIELTNNAWISKYNFYDTCYFGIFYQNPNPNACAEFAEFLLIYE